MKDYYFTLNSSSNTFTVTLNNILLHFEMTFINSVDAFSSFDYGILVFLILS